MMRQSFQERLKMGELLIGTFMTLPSPEVAEILADVGFEWLLVDMEHTSLTIRDVQHILQAIGDKCACLVRVPTGDAVWLGRALDAGADGVIIPHVNSADEVRHIIRTCLYPPDGTRSVGLARAQRYGLRFEDYMAHAHQTIAIVPQIEHTEGVTNIGEIVKVPGITAIFIGPYDLSGSLGKLGEIEDSDVQKSVIKVKDTCSEAGLPTGIFCMDDKAASAHIEDGFSLITVGMDIQFLGESARATLQKLLK